MSFIMILDAGAYVQFNFVFSFDALAMNSSDNLKAFKSSVKYTALFVSTLWCIQAYVWLSGTDLGYLGVYPLTLRGALGIFTSPLIHGDPLHLLSNTFPLIVLGIGLFYFYSHIAKKVFIMIYLLTGAGVWMIARDAYHIGASGIIYGLLSFLFFIGLFNKDNKSISISLIVLFLYGGMITGLFPSNMRISYESHLMGAFAGVLVAFIYRKQGFYGQTEKAPEEEDENQDAGMPDFSEPSHTHSSSGAKFKIHYKAKENP